MKNVPICVTTALMIPSISHAAGDIGFVALQGAIVGGFLVIVIMIVKAVFSGAKKVTEKAKPKIENLAGKAGSTMSQLANKGSDSLKNIGRSKEEQLLDIDDSYFEKAAQEISKGAQVQGLWLKSLSLADGNIERQKATYIRLRARQLSDITSRHDN